MLKIKNLTKIFKTQKGISNTALDDVSFTLPDHGLAFIVGKSGSGKTTLLSLIGGLDNITSGNIYVNDKDITKLSHTEADNFRNKYIGYIYQDYQLIEDLTIFENLKFVLDLKRDEDLVKISEALKSVGLEGYESRFPRELSGGQKQRVAIARVIVKDPSIILADEPTGNLDINTTKQIIELLKELSKTKLIVFVSHNIVDAKAYADYLIYLDEGHMVGNYQKKASTITSFDILDKTLYLPLHRHLEEDEKEQLIEKLNQEEVQDIIQYNEDYEAINEDFKVNNNYNVDKKKHMRYRHSLHYGLKYFKGHRLKSTIFAFLSAIILSFVGLCLLLTTVIDSKVLNDYEYRDNHNVLEAHKLNDNKADRGFFAENAIIKDDYESILKKHGYTGKVYRAMPCLDITRYSFSTPFRRESLKPVNIVVTDEEYLASLFSDNGELEFIAKDDTPSSGSFYVTDYFIDSYLFLEGKAWTQENYEAIFDEKHLFNCEVLVSGIINSHYRERYPGILKYMTREKEYEALLKEPWAEDYYNDCICSYLNLYTFDENTYYDWIRSDDVVGRKNVNSVLTYNGSNINFKHFYYKGKTIGIELNEDEIMLPYTAFNLLTDSSVSTKGYVYLDEPIEVSLSSYLYGVSRNPDPLLTQKLKVVGYTYQYCFLSDENIYKIHDAYNQTTSLFYSDPSQLDAIMSANNEMGLVFMSVAEDSIITSCRYLSTTKEIFKFFLICLIVVTIIGLIYYNQKILKNRIHDVGIMKSLGARDVDIITMLSINVTETLVKTLVFYNILQVILAYYSNDVLVKAIRSISQDVTIFLPNVHYVLLTGGFMIFMNLVIIIFILLAFFIPFIKIRFIKPTNIVKAKE